MNYDTYSGIQLSNKNGQQYATPWLNLKKHAEPKKPDTKDYRLCEGQDQGQPGDKGNLLCDVLEQARLICGGIKSSSCLWSGD